MLSTKLTSSRITPGLPGRRPSIEWLTMILSRNLARPAGLALAGCLLSGSFAQQLPPMQPEMPWPKPGSRHEILKKLEGIWYADVEVFAKPGEPPVKSPGLETVSPSCNGLWYTVHIDCTEKGLPYEGHGLIGFDPTLNHFTGVWADVTGTQFSEAQGQLDANDSLVFTGSGPDPRAPEQTIKFKQVIEFPKKNVRAATLHLIDSSGVETKWMRTEYKLKNKKTK